MFFKVEVSSVHMIKQVFDKFSCALELQANCDKSSVYFSGVNPQVKQDILNLLGFNEGTLPFKYLGVPLLSKKTYNQSMYVSEGQNYREDEMLDF